MLSNRARTAQNALTLFLVVLLLLGSLATPRPPVAADDVLVGAGDTVPSPVAPGPGDMVPDGTAGMALQFDGTNDYVTFGQTRYTPGTLAYTGTSVNPTWNTIATSKLGGSSLTFNGSTQYVTTGVGTALNSAAFTVEVWFYRTAAGLGVTTGDGGVTSAIPLLTKGTSEAESPAADVNYFLGIDATSAVLVADFEEGVGGANPSLNHPIAGTTAIALNTWYHAAATYDGTTWRLFLNGNSEGELFVGQPANAAVVSPLALASSIRSNGTTIQGYFAGRLDEARVWNYARTQAEIQASMNSEILVPTTGLLGRWGLNDASGTTAANLNRLGLTSFTLEAWVKRAAGGATMSTGSLGLDGASGRPLAYPVLAKGMGEGETPANINTNWFLGITSTGVVGADFEDTAGGVNRPAWGTTVVTLGVWHHIAATYTGSCWALYLDCNRETLNGTACPNATPESTSYQRAALSAGINSTGGLGTGYFSGVIDEARVWNRALSPEEILANKDLELTSGTGLVARWGMNEGTGSSTVSSAGTFPGTLTNGPIWVEGFPLPGAPSDPPVVTNPGAQSSSEGDTISLQISATDPDVPLAYSATGLPDGLAINATTGHIAGTISYRSGASSPYSVTVTVTDSRGAPTPVNFAWTVAQAASGLCSGPTSGLVGCWPMEENSGTWLVDATANGNDGAITGSPAWVAGKTGLALSLSGTGQYAVVPDSDLLDISTNSITLSAWVKPTKTGFATQNIIKKAIGTASGNGYELSLSGPGKVFVRFGSVATRIDSTTSYPVNGTAWMHIAATYDGTTIRLYVDGAQENSADVSFSITANTAGLGIGVEPATTPINLFQGLVDDARVYNRALTPDEIRELAGLSHAPVAVNDSYEATQNVTLSVAAPGVLGNDTDASGHPLTAIEVSDPTHGALTLNADGSFSYAPTTGYTGPDSFTYKANDGVLDSNVATVSLTVTEALNQPPQVTNPGAQTSSEGQTVSLQIYATDADSDSLTYGATGLPPGLSIGPNTGLITGTSGYRDAGSYNVTVTVNDAQGHSPSVAFAWTVAQAASGLCSGPTSGLVGCWPMEENGGTWLVDATANGNDGAITGSPAWVAGKTGAYALNLPGTTNALAPDSASLDIASQITLAAWVRPAATTTQNLIKKAVNSNTNGYELSLAAAGSAADQKFFVRFNQTTSGDTYRVNSTTNYPVDGTWVHVAATYDGAAIRLYLNGVLNNSLATPTSITIVTNALALGIAADSNGANKYSGTLDDARVYNRALSEAEIATLASVSVAQPPSGLSCTVLNTKPQTAGTGEKPQSKVWEYDGAWWSVFPTNTSGASSAGTWLWRLEGTAWTDVLKLSDRTDVKADTKVAEGVVHALLYAGTSTQLVSVEYSGGTYQPWSARTSAVSIPLSGSEIATIDIDSIGRMWLATENGTSIVVHYSDSPYSTWSGPITLATGVNDDDISVVKALPTLNAIGVLWSNQVTQLFGFRLHADGTDPTVWSADELPASQSALSVGSGMADDHLNVAVASDGTLYAAVKTSYDNTSYPKIALLVRRPAGTWDDLYDVSRTGTRGIVQLDEAAGHLTVVYTASEGNNDIVYRQSALNPISFGAQMVMSSTDYNDVSGMKQNYTGDLLVIYSSGSVIAGSLCTSSVAGQPAAPSNLTALTAPGSQIDLAWTDNASNETGFQVEYAASNDCATVSTWATLGTVAVNATTFRHWNTTVNAAYCYRVLAAGTTQNSAPSGTATATTPANYSALSLGRSSAYVRMTTDQAAVKLKMFTVETWFRREGPGVTNTTGTDGIPNAIPLVARGSAEAEGTTADENFLLVIDDATDVLAADFEECDNADTPAECPAGGTAGLNHPIRGVTPIELNRWYHAAVTFDGNKWQLFLNGTLEKELVVGRLPRWDNTSPLGLGTSMRTTGTAQGFFDGSLDEVRIWNYARSEAEIRAAMNTQIATATAGLAARWSLDEASGTAVSGSAGTTINGSIYPSGTATGWNWTADAPFNASRPPAAPALVAPTDGASGVSGVTLQATVSDLDGGDLTVNFYGRPYCESEPFTLVALPDTQYYSAQINGGTRAIFDAQTQWIVDKRADRNIQYVTHLGDVVDTDNTTQWDVAAKTTDTKGALTKLDDAGIEYGIALGNHDGAPDSTAIFRTYFPTSPPIRAGEGYETADPDNRYGLFEAGTLKFIVVHIEYGADPDTRTWADSVLVANSDRRAIVVTHNLLSGTANPAPFTTEGNLLYQQLKDNPNLFLMLGGHATTEVSRTDTFEGRTVYSLRSDYQDRTNGGNGWLRLMEFQPALNKIHVSTYSPYLNQSETDANSLFSLDYAMGGAGCADFQPIGTPVTVASGSSATLNWTGLQASTRYEWYVTVNDGTNTVTGPTWSFTTGEIPTAVELVSFEARPSPGGIRLAWQVASELDTAGYRLWRSDSADGDYEQVSGDLIPAYPGGLMPADYTWEDTGVVEGQVYYYKLEERDTHGVGTLYGPVWARAGMPYRILLPLLRR